MIKKSTGSHRRTVNTFNWRDYFIYIVFFAILVVFGIVLRGKGFFTGSNLLNIARQTAMISVMAIGMTFVLSTAEIDLSFASIVALSSLTTALTLRYTDSVILAVIVGLATGAIIGLTNGIFVSRVRIPSFLVTLGMTGIITGFARWITQLRSIPVTNKTYNFVFGSGDIGPIPILFVWTIILVTIGEVTLRKTRFGREVLATGGNKQAAFYSGVNVDRIKLAVLTLNGCLAAFAGMLYAGRLHGARYSLGENDLMIVIAAVIIGGTNLFGGKGSVIGSVMGAIIMGMINNGLILMGLSVDQQMIFRGMIIIFAVAFTRGEKAGR